MTTPELKRVFTPIVFIFRVMGLWPTETNRIVYRIYGIMQLGIFSLLLTATMVIQLLAFTELDQITKTMYMTLAQLSLFLKVVNFYVRLNAMQEIVDETETFQLNSFAEVKLFNKRMRFIYRLVIALIVSCNIAHFSAEFKAIMTPEMLLPFPCWYPNSWFDGGFKYFLAYSHQSMGAFFTSNLNGAMEAFSGACLYMISVQMEILGSRLKCIGIDSDEIEASIGNDRIKRRRKQFEHIEQCIQIHQKILKL